jgi:transcriptional regulator with XRE-family HTH domain
MGRHRVTQTALAKDLGMGQSALSERLNGLVPWTIDDLYKVAARFGVPVTDLFVTDERPYSSLRKIRDCSYTGVQMDLFGHQDVMIARSLELVKA